MVQLSRYWPSSSAKRRLIKMVGSPRPGHGFQKASCVSPEHRDGPWIACSDEDDSRIGGKSK
jgi:hypothetical protein